MENTQHAFSMSLENPKRHLNRSGGRTSTQTGARTGGRRGESAGDPPRARGVGVTRGPLPLEDAVAP